MKVFIVVDLLLALSCLSRCGRYVIPIWIDIVVTTKWESYNLYLCPADQLVKVCLYHIICKVTLSLTDSTVIIISQSTIANSKY